MEHDPHSVIHSTLQIPFKTFPPSSPNFCNSYWPHISQAELFGLRAAAGIWWNVKWVCECAGPWAGGGMIPLTLKMCPLSLKLKTSPLSTRRLQPRQMALSRPSWKQRSCLVSLGNVHGIMDREKPDDPRLPALLIPGC